MKPFDPRLVRHASAAKGFLAAAIALGLVMTGLVLAQAALLAHALAHADRGVHALSRTLGALAVVLLLRAVVTYGREVAALRAAAAVKSQLRRGIAERIAALGPSWAVHRRAGEVTTLMTRGLDALDPYFSRYLPQIVLATVVPIAVLALVATNDPVSAVVIAVTLPLIPVFMVLVGMHTRARTERQWHLLARLGGHFLDVVEGLPTLKVFGRAKAQVEAIRRVTDEHRQATMATLRVAFLSALVLELLATVATAVVAVEVGLRLLAGGIPYETALLVLLLTPEAYLPLRVLGTEFHASLEGVTAAQQALDLIDGGGPEQAAPATGSRTLARWHEIRFEGVTVQHSDRTVPAADEVSFTIRRGEMLAIAGGSGAGKSTVLAVLLRLLTPSAGCVTVDGVALTDLDVDAWRQQIAWVPQHAYLFTGSLADNIRFGNPAASDAQVQRAAAAAGVLTFSDELARGLETLVGERGLTLSTGQRQRVALARAFIRDAPLVLLDEPTAHLDEDTARDVRAAVLRLVVGRTVVVVSHVHGWTAGADRVLEMSAGTLRSPLVVAT